MIIAGIPAFNEAKVIGRVISKTLQFVDQVIVVDDGSTDDTLLVAQKAGAKVIHHEENLGKGAALKSIFQFAKNSSADILVTIDGDGQFLPEEIPNLINSLKNNNSDIVIGYRFENKNEIPKYREIGNKILDKVTNLAAELPFRDTQSGFRIYSKKAINEIKFSSNGFVADSEILIDASKKDLKVSEEKITVIYDTGYETSTQNPISHSTSVLSSLIEYVALKRPLTLMGVPGLIMTIIGVIFTIVVVSTFNETRYFSVPFTLISIGSLVIGSFLFLVSIILYSISKTMRNND